MLDTRRMLTDVNGEIKRLTMIRDLLMMENGTTSPLGTERATTPFRPMEIKAPAKAVAGTTATATTATAPAKAKRVLSPEAKANIAAGLKKRWAAARKKGLSMNGRPLKNKPKKAAKRAYAKRAAPTTQMPQAGMQM